MEEINLVSEALKFMVLGMTVVFIFLAVLVQLMKLQAKLVEKYFPDKPVVKPTPSGSTDDRARTAAIIAAVTEFNKNKS